MGAPSVRFPEYSVPIGCAFLERKSGNPKEDHDLFWGVPYLESRDKPDYNQTRSGKL